jgi:hypothetical protein
VIDKKNGTTVSLKGRLLPAVFMHEAGKRGASILTLQKIFSSGVVGMVRCAPYGLMLDA